MAYSPITKLKNNTEALKLAIEWDGHSKFTPAQVSILKQYSGFGGLKAVLFGDGPFEDWKDASKSDRELFIAFKELYDMLKWNLTGKEYKAALDSVKNSILTAFYTPSVVPETFFRILKQFHEVKWLYEPSAGAGIFLQEGVKAFDELTLTTAYEKDLLTGKVLQAVNSSLSTDKFRYMGANIQGFETSDDKENGRYDLITSNIPYGSFPVFDPAIKDRNLTAKIHNYFFAKGLEKISDGGVLAYLVSSAFLNTMSNKSAREYLFSRADFISLSVMPDNLMKDIGNTEAPSHFLVVRKKVGKSDLSDEEKLLLESTMYTAYGTPCPLNNYLQKNWEECVIGEHKIGKDQYGKPNLEVWWKDGMDKITHRFAYILVRDFENRYEVDPGDVEAHKAALHDFQNFGKRMEALNEHDQIEEELCTICDKPLGPLEIKRGTHIACEDAQAEYEETVEAEAKAQEEQPEEKLFHFSDNDASRRANEKDLAFFGNRGQQQEEESQPEQTHFDEPVMEEINQIFNADAVPFKSGVIVNRRKGKKELFEDDYELLRIMSIDNGQISGALPELKNNKEREIMAMYIKVRDAYYVVERWERLFDGDHSVQRGKLKTAYDEFVDLHGCMNKTRNKNIILKDVYGFTVLASVEVKTGNDFVPADVLTKSNKGETEVFKTDNPVDALSYCLGNFGRVNMPFICEVTDKPEEEVVMELGDLIYVNPTTLEWETADKYLSGNVYLKMIQARYAYENRQTDDLQLKRSLDAITEVQPKKIPFELLDFNLGERWISHSYYERFADWLFEMKHPSRISLVYFPSIDVFKTNVIGSYSAKMTREYYIRSKGRVTLQGHDLLEYAIENTTPFLTYKDWTTGLMVPDNDAIQLAAEKIETIRSKFIEWLNSLGEEDKEDLVNTYNRTYNCYVLRKYDGSHLTFPGLDLSKIGKDDTPVMLYDSQKDTSWRVIQDNGSIVDHEVGSGKTLIMVLAAHEMKRMGIRRKPAILCLKSNVADIVKTYRKAYPHAKILAPAEVDFEKKNRKRLFHEMKNNDWDCVIMTHDQFGKIPQSTEIQQEIIQEELDNLERDLESLEDADYSISRSMKKGLETRKATLSAKLQTIADQIANTKDDDVDFEDMGIDHLLIDEAHKFKNLTFSTRHDRVAGLGNTIGSNKALNMLFAIRTLQKRFDADLQATFLSGTPISNSLTEMYLLFKYLRPREMARQNILNFDAWAAVFAKKTTDFEFSVTNQIIAKERFRHFIKVPELALFYNEIADYRTNKSINIDKPELVEELVPLKPTEDQKEFIKNLIAFAKTGDGELIGRGKLTEAEDKARMLIATNYAKKMSTDMRLIDEVRYGDHPDNKISICAEKVAYFYHTFEQQKGTQIIFCDIGTPKPNQFNVYDAMKDKLVQEYGLPEAEIVFIHNYNERTRHKLFKDMNDGIIRILLGSTDKAGTGLNVQQRVVAMHHLDIPWKPAELEQRSGRGARQGNWVAKCHNDNKVYNFIYAVEQSLDNYKFTLLKNKQTFISQMKKSELAVRSIDEGSFDESTGMNFAEYIAILSGDTTLLEKAKIDKKLAMLDSLRDAHYRQQSNNKYILGHKVTRLEEVEEVLATLKRDNELYESLMTKDEIGAKNNPIEIFVLKDALVELEKKNAKALEDWEIEKVDRRRRRAEERARVKDALGETEPVEEEKEEKQEDESWLKDKYKEPAAFIGEYLIKLWKEWKPKTGETTDKIGQLYGFNLFIERKTNQDDGYMTQQRAYNGTNNIMFFNLFYAQHPNGGLKYTFNQGVPVRDNSKLAARNFINAIDRVGIILKQYAEEQERLLFDIAGLKSVEERPFSKEDEITRLTEESKRLEREIKIKIQKSQVAEESNDHDKNGKKKKAEKV